MSPNKNSPGKFLILVRSFRFGRLNATEPNRKTEATRGSRVSARHCVARLFAVIHFILGKDNREQNDEDNRGKNNPGNLIPQDETMKPDHPVALRYL